MLYTCESCGKTRLDMGVDGERSVLICPSCGHEKAFRRLPLFAIGGASGSGKTAVCQALAGKVPGVICLDGDLFWDRRFTQDAPDAFYEYVLRISANIAQSGVPVAIFNAGFGIPGNLESCPSRRFFSEIHYLALWCEEEELERRLRTREGATDEFIQGMKGFNAFFRFGAPGSENGPAVERLNTSGKPLEETTASVREWIEKNREEVPGWTLA